MPLLICPNCRAGMKEVERNGVMIDVCPECRGVWLDGGEFDKFSGQVQQFERGYRDEVEGYRREYGQRPYTRRDDTDYDDDYQKGKRKSKLGRLFDLFD